MLSSPPSDDWVDLKRKKDGGLASCLLILVMFATRGVLYFGLGRFDGTSILPYQGSTCVFYEWIFVGAIAITGFCFYCSRFFVVFLHLRNVLMSPKLITLTAAPMPPDGRRAQGGFMITRQVDLRSHTRVLLGVTIMADPAALRFEKGLVQCR